MIRCTLDLLSGRLVLNKTVLWSEMGNSAEEMLYGVMLEQQTKSKIWPLLWLMKLTYCVRLKQSNIGNMFTKDFKAMLSK